MKKLIHTYPCFDYSDTKTHPLKDQGSKRDAQMTRWQDCLCVRRYPVLIINVVIMSCFKRFTYLF